MNDQITFAAFTLVPGVLLTFSSLIALFMVIWSDFSNINQFDNGFQGWFWKTFRYWIIGMIILGIILISIFYACQVV